MSHDHVSNADFITGIFGTLTDAARPVVTSFKGKPNWFGQAWTGQALSIENNNNYVSFATYKPNPQGQYKRKKTAFDALHAVMLDDIGTKIDARKITLAPSWRIETSAGNFQCGFILAEPITDAKAADALLNAIIDAGLCDPGANAPCTRIGRLPVGSNTKHNPAFRTVLHDWNPDLRYSPQQILDGLGIEAPLKTPDRMPDAVHIQANLENPVITALKDRGLYKSKLDDFTHDVTCPWVHEHTNEIDHGSAFFEPSQAFPHGGFKCQHGHCAGRNLRDLCEFLKVDPADARNTARIIVKAGELNRICDAAEIELAKTGRFFQRAGSIVTIGNNGVNKTIKPVSIPSLTRALAGIAVWQIWSKTSQSFTPTDPPERHVRMLYDADFYKHLPVLNALSRQPVLRADGTLMDAPGYDALTGIYGEFNAGDFSIPEHPKREQALEALELLKDLLSEFSFASEHDRSAALAAMLTASMRVTLPTAPMFHVNAPAYGSGKSFLCALISAFATPVKNAPHSFPTDDAECKKLLLSELMKSPRVIEFDNLTSDLVPFNSLCSVLTSEHMTGRILGVSKTVSVSTRTLFLSSGNNVQPLRDMGRRALTINLDPRCETPVTRVFTRPNLLDEVLRDRARCVSAALTIIRAYICAGKPEIACKPLAGFTHWSELVRKPLIWLGLPDPCHELFEGLTRDPDRETLAAFLNAWHAAFGTTPKSLNEINAFHSDVLHEVVYGIAGEANGAINLKRLGWWLKKHQNRRVNGFFLLKDKERDGRAFWKVEKT